MAERILILGGTKEAASLAAKLVDEGHEVTTSLAGRTKEPEPVKGKCRIGGFGGVEGLATYLKEQRIDRLIDVTHPFARQISENAVAAAKQVGLPLEVKTRAPWEKTPNDNWIEVSSLEEARDKIPAGSRTLLALGHQYIELFNKREDVFFLIRMVDPPKSDLTFANYEVLVGKPSSEWQAEADILEKNAITHIVCRNSGGKGAYAKIEAARYLKIPVIILERT